MLKDKNAAFLGYCRMSFAEGVEFAQTPKLEVQKLNPREISSTSFNQLKKAVGADDTAKPFSALARFAPQHAMFLVLPGRFVKPSALEKNMFATDFPTIAWTDAALLPESKVTLANGNHRRMLCLSFARGALDELKKIQGDIEKMTGVQGTTLKLNALYDKRASLTKKAQDAACWLVAVYDQGKHCCMKLCRIFTFSQTRYPRASTPERFSMTSPRTSTPTRPTTMTVPLFSS